MYGTPMSVDTYIRHLSYFFFFFLMIRRPPRSTLFPYTTSSDLYGAAPDGTSGCGIDGLAGTGHTQPRSEENTSELQSRFDLVCRLLLEKKKNDRSAIDVADDRPHRCLSDQHT